MKKPGSATFAVLVSLFASIGLASCAATPFENGALSDEDLGAATAALEAGNVATLRRTFARLPRHPTHWKEGDREFRDQLFAAELYRGRGCRPAILNYLISIGADTDWNRLKEIDYRESAAADYYQAALCGRYLLDSYARQLGRTELQDDNPGAWDALVRTMVVGTHNAFADYTNWKLAGARDPEGELGAYFALMKASIPYVRTACLLMKSSSEACSSLSMYRRLGSEMTQQDVSNKPYAKKWTQIADLLAKAK